MKRPISFTVYEDITASVKTQLTELHRSYSKVKCLLVITEIPLDEEYLRPLQLRLVYGADDAEIDEFIQAVKNKSHRICQ